MTNIAYVVFTDLASASGGLSYLYTVGVLGVDGNLVGAPGSVSNGPYSSDPGNAAYVSPLVVQVTYGDTDAQACSNITAAIQALYQDSTISVCFLGHPNSAF